MYKVIDLFAGAGGLSLGFVQAQNYDIKVAFENSTDMQCTYQYNHPNVDVRGDVCAANYDEIQNKYGKIDVVIGGPPCQGFSNANRQKNHAISQNNMLVKQYIRAIQELQPKAFVMENVSMLRSDVHRFYLDQTDKTILNPESISMQDTKLSLLEKEFLFDNALNIVKDAESVQKYLWPEEEYKILNVIYKTAKNIHKMISALKKHQKELMKMSDAHNIQSDNNTDYILGQESNAFSAIKNYFNGINNIEEIKSAIEPTIMIQRMLSKAKEIFDNRLVVEKYVVENGLYAIIKSYAVFDYLRAILESNANNYVINSQVLCAADFGAPQKRKRFVVIGIKKDLTDKVVLPKGHFTENNYPTVRDAIEDLQNVSTVTEVSDDVGTPISKIKNISPLGKQLRNSKCLYNHIVTKTTAVAMERFCALKPGQNFHSLDESLKTNTYTDITRTQNTIYLRLDYDQPCGTVLNVRKSMWVHPVLNRAISVREAARLQTFPDSFIFRGTKDKQYQQVGNAVPPIMAKAIAENLAMQLNAEKK